MTKKYDVLLIGWKIPPTWWGPKSFWIDVDDVALSKGLYEMYQFARITVPFQVKFSMACRYQFW